MGSLKVGTFIVYLSTVVEGSTAVNQPFGLNKQAATTQWTIGSERLGHEGEQILCDEDYYSVY